MSRLRVLLTKRGLLLKAGVLALGLVLGLAGQAGADVPWPLPPIDD